MTIVRIGHRYADAESSRTLDVWFPKSSGAIDRHCIAEELGVIRGDFVEVRIESFANAPQSAEEVYLRLHLLSELEVKPNQINLEGIFGLLNNVAWSSAGPLLPSKVLQLRAKLSRSAHQFGVPSVDKFPRMTDYVIPEGVRIADADRVRLGAHLASGTTVMHEGFVSFNAGTLGESMIEGRVTPGVVIGKHSDVGAGASIMGTLSGGGTRVNSVGERSLIGANAGIGISLGDDCVVEAGLYVTAGTKVRMPDGSIRAAREVSGQSGLLYWRNSLTGAVEVKYRGSTRGEWLNNQLHNND